MIVCPMITVTVARAAIEQIPTDVYAHEIHLLQEVHGEDNITVDTPEPILHRELTYQGEYARLGNKYGLVPESKNTFVETVYGPMSSGQLKAAMERGMEIVHDLEYEPTPIAQAATPRTVVAPEPDAGSYPWLKAKLKMYAVDFGHNSKKKDLEKLLRQEICERLHADYDTVVDIPIGELNEQLTVVDKVA